MANNVIQRQIARVNKNLSSGKIEFKLPLSFKGKYVGVLILVVFQVFVGSIHVVFGLILAGSYTGLVAYGAYTFLYGIIAAASVYGLYMGKRWGWLGTIVISLIVIIIDVFTVLDLPIIPGVPKFAATGEIPYSIVVIIYLIQPKITKIFLRKKLGNSKKK